MSATLLATDQLVHDLVEDRPRLNPPLARENYTRILAATRGSGTHLLHWLAISPYFLPVNQYGSEDYYQEFICHLSELFPLITTERAITHDTFELFFNPIYRIDAEIYATIMHGIRFYLREDHLAAIYILTLQLEDLLRIILHRNGGSPHETTRNGLEKKPLGRVMSELKPALPPSVYAYVMWLLKDKGGLNLRNAVAHGFFKSADAKPIHAVTLVHLLCVLTVHLKTDA